MAVRGPVADAPHNKKKVWFVSPSVLPGRWSLVLLALLSLAISGTASAQRFCVFDPMGTSGDYYAIIKDYQLIARRWGLSIELRAYSDESIAVEDFKAGQCDMMNMTGFRARQFNQFTGTIDSPGAIENYAELRDVLNLMATPKVDKFMTSGQYEVVGMVPLGAGYPFVRDRAINSLAKAAGKKVAVMEWDKVQAILVQEVGAQPINSDITNYGGKFNNGQVDVIIAPIILYKPFELYRGIGTKGGIIRRPLVQLTMQILARKDKFPPEFGRESREYVATQVDHAFGVIRNLENGVEQRQWMYVPTAERVEYNHIMRDARMHLTAQGFFDKRMLGILKRIRCKSNPEDAECSQPDE
jgi:hypothetical protein